MPTVDDGSPGCQPFGLPLRGRASFGVAGTRSGSGIHGVQPGPDRGVGTAVGGQKSVTDQDHRGPVVVAIGRDQAAGAEQPAAKGVVLRFTGGVDGDRIPGVGRAMVGEVEQEPGA